MARNFYGFILLLVLFSVPFPAMAEKLNLVGNMVANITEGSYEYDSIYVDETSRIMLRGNVVLNVTGPVTIRGDVLVDYDHLEVSHHGADGAPGDDGEGTDLLTGHGDPGQSGTDGDPGQPGFNLSINAGGDVLISGEIDLSGGNGGKGGDGGDGQNGVSREPLGPNNTDHIIGNGGNGGIGGNGGRGEHGGNLIIRTPYQLSITGTSRIDLSGGDGGLAGAGGSGGNAVNTTSNELIATGGVGGMGGYSGSGSYSGSLTLTAGGCLNIENLAEIDLSGGDSQSPQTEEDAAGGFGGDGSVALGLVGAYNAGNGGKGAQGGNGGQGGVLTAYSAGPLTIGLQTELFLDGGNGGSGGNGGTGGNGPSTDRTSCLIASGGHGGAGGYGGQGGTSGILELRSMENVNFEQTFTVKSGDGGKGGDGGNGGHGGSSFYPEPPSCGHYQQGVGGYGGAGGEGGSSGLPLTSSFYADETLFLGNLTVGSGNGGNGGAAGRSGGSGTAPDDTIECPGTPLAPGNGGNAFGPIAIYMKTDFLQGEVAMLEAQLGTTGAPGEFYTGTPQSCWDNVLPPEGENGKWINEMWEEVAEPTFFENREYGNTYASEDMFGYSHFPNYDTESEWARGDCERCLVWDDPRFPDCLPPVDGDLDEIEDEIEIEIEAETETEMEGFDVDEEFAEEEIEGDDEISEIVDGDLDEVGEFEPEEEIAENVDGTEDELESNPVDGDMDEIGEAGPADDGPETVNEDESKTSSDSGGSCQQAPFGMTAWLLVVFLVWSFGRRRRNFER